MCSIHDLPGLLKKPRPHSASSMPSGPSNSATAGVYPSRSGLRAATHTLTLQRPLLGPHAGHLFHLAYGHGVAMHTHASSQRANAASRSEAAAASASFFSAACSFFAFAAAATSVAGQDPRSQLPALHVREDLVAVVPVVLDFPGCFELPDQRLDDVARHDGGIAEEP